MWTTCARVSYDGRMATTTVPAAPSHTPIPQWTLADRLTKARRHAGLEQPELADMIGIARSSLSAYENGHRIPRRPVLLSWALATGVPLEWLTDGSRSCPACGGTGGDTGMTCFLCNGQVKAEVVGQEPLFDADDFRHIEAFANGAEAAVA